MTYTELELQNLILDHPLDDGFRIQLEDLLRETEPNGVDVELLRRERLIAATLEHEPLTEEAIREYERFRIAHSNYFWDMRGFLDHLFRPFSLWLIACNPERSFALSVAIKHKSNPTTDLARFPAEIAFGLSPDGAYGMMRGIVDFVRRYRGPSGKEPDLADDEIKFEVLASYSTKYADAECLRTRPSTDAPRRGPFRFDVRWRRFD